MRSSASIRGSARQRGGGGAVAAYREAKGSRATQEDAAAAAAIMAKLAGGGGRGKGKGRAGGGGAAGAEGGDVESLQEQVGRSLLSFGVVWCGVVCCTRRFFHPSVVTQEWWVTLTA